MKRTRWRDIDPEGDRDLRGTLAAAVVALIVVAIVVVLIG